MNPFRKYQKKNIDRIWFEKYCYVDEETRGIT